jgi:2-iminobutanoate/2-iminopropanoate deaminase
MAPATASAREAQRAELKVPGLAPAISHYTDAVRFGDLLFVSGMIAVDENLNLVGGNDVVVQTRCIFQNMEQVLAAVGATFADVLKVTVFLLDVNDRSKINSVRQEYFGSARPASTLIGVRELALPGVKIEIEAVVGLRRS